MSRVRAVCIVVISLLSFSAQAQSLKVSGIPDESPTELLRKFKPLGSYLEKEIGILPASLHELLSYSVYRWECAIRASVVMGFVGAGGLGQQMELSIRMLAGGEVATMLLAFLALVLLADAVSALLRKVLI